MMALRELPKRSELVDFKDAVAGHAGTLCDSEGVLFIKPCTQAEIDFYEDAQANHPEMADLMPLFMGTLMLNDVTDAHDIAEQLPAVAEAIPEDVKEALAEFGHHHAAPSAALQSVVPVPAVAVAPAAAAAPVDNETWVPRGSQSISTDRAIVLENTTYGYKKPNVLDVKLGQRLWADDAPRQKRVRMDEVRAQTTHDKLGFRISGMKVFKGEAEAENGEAAKVLDESGYKTYDKDFGRYEVNNDNVVDAFRRFLFNETAGIDEEHARAIAVAFRTDLERVRDVLEKERTRMYSASLLFVFEGDGEALRTAVAEGNAQASSRGGSRSRSKARTATSASRKATVDITITEAEARSTTPMPVENCVTEDATLRSRSRREPLGKIGDRSSSRTDSGIVLDDDEFDTDVEDGGVSIDSDEDRGDYDTVDDDDDDDDDEESSMPRIYSLRLIDFAHAKFVPQEEHPDENILVGVRSLIRIFDELAK